MYKTTIYNWDIFNCPFPPNISIYTAPEMWLYYFNNKRASGIKLDTKEPIMVISSQIKKVEELENFSQISMVETNNSKYYFFGPPNEKLKNYLIKNNYEIPKKWNGREITKAINYLLTI